VFHHHCNIFPELFRGLAVMVCLTLGVRNTRFIILNINTLFWNSWLGYTFAYRNHLYLE
jgi:hypothetical protein